MAHRAVHPKHVFICMQAGDVKKTADYVAQVGLCSLVGVWLQICSKGACEVIAMSAHSAAHICVAESSLSAVNLIVQHLHCLGWLALNMSALCVCVSCASPAALACPSRNDVTMATPCPVPAVAQGGRRTRPMALAESAAGKRCTMASSSLACLPVLAGTLPTLLAWAGMLLAWPLTRWLVADQLHQQL